MEGEITLDSGSGESSTANLKFLDSGAGESSSANLKFLDSGSGESSTANLKYLDDGSGESSTANLKFLDDGSGECCTHNQWFNLDDDDGEPSSNAAVKGNAGESSILTRLRHTMFHQLKHTQFTQQDLPAWKPIITPKWAMTIFMAVGLFAIPIGIITLAASHHVVEIVHRYDVECMKNPPPAATTAEAAQTLMDRVSYIQNPTVDHRCNVTLVVPKAMKHPVFFYQLTKFHQNHRRYMKSRSTKQHQGEDLSSVASCHPIARLSKTQPIVPCGLMAWTLFNDTYDIHLLNASSPNAPPALPIPVVRTRIAWKSDVQVKFSSKVYPKNFPNNVNHTGRRGSTRLPIGGASLDPRVPLSQDENLMVWMRPAPLPRFRKLYGHIQHNLHAGQVIQVDIANVDNTYSFKGSKSLVLSTTSFLGGKNPFLGRAYLSMGVLCMVMAFVSFLIQLHHPRPLGDHSRLTWNRHPRF